MIRIIHFSDLHLDSGIFENDKKRADLRKKEQRSLFANILMYARDQHADLILIAGDLLDRRDPDEETKALILREFENTPQAQIVIACGRSDPYRPGCFFYETAFPSNVHIFGSEELSYIDLPALGARVYGYSFCKRNLPRSPIAVVPVLDASLCNIFVGHTTLRGDARTAPTDEGQIERSRFDYLALGGDHEPTELLKAGESFYAMSGSPEGVDFDDCGMRGIRIVAMDKRDGQLLLQSKRIALSHRRFEKCTVSVEGKEIADVAEEALACIRERQIDKDCRLMLRLTGCTARRFSADDPAFDRVRARVGYFLTVDDTLFQPSVQTPGGREEFKEIFCRFASEKTDDPRLRSRILKTGLAALEGGRKERGE